MASSPDRKRVEVPAALYTDLERHARLLHISPTALATMLLADALQAAEARSHVPFYARREPSIDQAMCNHQWDDKGRPECYCLKCGLMLVRAE